MSTTLTPAEAAWQEPTVHDAFIDGTTGRVPGTDTFPVRSLVFTVVLLVAAAAIMPDLRYLSAPLSIIVAPLFVFAIQVVRAWRLQVRFGRSRAHAGAASLGWVTAVGFILLLFAAVSLTIGRPGREAPFDRALDALFRDDPGRASVGFVVYLLALGILAIVVDRAYGRRKRAEFEAAIEAASQREKAARARAHERSVS